CGRKPVARGLCSGHSLQRRRGKELTPLRTPTVGCSFPDCDNQHSAFRLCDGHRQQQRRGQELRPLRKRVRYGGGWRVSVEGYLIRNASGRIVFEHREVMEKALGRKLLPSENVHHVNGNRADNRLENLELWSTSQP